MGIQKRGVSDLTARLAAVIVAVAVLGGCSTLEDALSPHELMPAEAPQQKDWMYLIGPGDSLSIFVWRNPDLSSGGVVRPDGKITLPLVEDLPATGVTPTQLARIVEEKLSEFVRDPMVTVTVGGFGGEFEQQIRILGEAARPQAMTYREKMTLLDVMISVGGITDFAAGNRATIVRNTAEGQVQKRVRIEDLIRDGDISANVDMMPGDILIIPEAWF